MFFNVQQCCKHNKHKTLIDRFKLKLILHCTVLPLWMLLEDAYSGSVYEQLVTNESL